MKTFQPKKKDIKRDKQVIDAKGKILGRLASEISRYLMGKHKVTYANHIDMGDFVTVKNVSGIVVSGKKSKQKIYYRHSGYLGNLKKIKYEKVFSENPAKVLQLAVSGMLPDNRLKKDRMKRLKIFKGEEN